MDEINLWKLDSDQSVTSLDGLAQLETEWQLEEVLVKNPQLLEPGIELVGRQTPAAGGWLDLLGVDADGRLVVFELKRGSLGRDAVTQVLDYTSSLSEMEPSELAEHITKRSGQGGIPSIHDFAAWYTERFADLQHLYPIRMVLVGLGIDETALRVARFLSEASLKVEVVTFHGFRNEGDVLVARQLPVQREMSTRRQSSTVPIDERRRLLSQRLDDLGLTERFEAVRDFVNERLDHRAFVDAKTFGVSLQLDVRSVSGIRGPRPFFGVYAAYMTDNAIELSLNTITERHNPEEHAKLTACAPVIDWPHGGKAIVIEDREAWERLKPAIREFADAVYRDWQQYRNTPMDHSIVD